MIEEIDIRNFKCFEHISIKECSRINVIVGDNGAGKTALLEGMFMALGSTTELVARFRQFRGLDGHFRGSQRKIEDAIWRDYFHNSNMAEPISISLLGSGPEARSVRIERGRADSVLPLEDNQITSAPSTVTYTWKDYRGELIQLWPVMSKEGLRFPETGEDLPDFFFMASNQTYSSIENADRFSDLDEERAEKFVGVFAQQYPFVKHLTVRSTVGAPSIYAKVDGVKEMIPITAVSGGLNRLITILLMIASRQRSVVLIDEMENGIFHSHQKWFWEVLLKFARDYNSQLFITTHSAEFLDAMAEAVDLEQDEISLWRMGREDNRPSLRQFFGKQALLGIRAGEVR